MSKDKTKKRTIDIVIDDTVKIVLNLTKYREQLEKLMYPFINNTTGMAQFSLTECAEICEVDSPQLNYYVKEGVVSPIGKVGVGCKKYFSIDGLMTFYIVKELKRSMRINIECLKTLQKAIK